MPWPVCLGVTATVKLLMKLIQDHKEACIKEQNDSRRMLRVAGILTILDNVKDRIQKCYCKKKAIELRHCDTDPLSYSHVRKDKRIAELVDEKEKLRRKLIACSAASKSLEVMCSSLGKEKEIMTAELAKKVHELNEVEELVKHLKSQNETLLAKVRDCAAEHKDGKALGEAEIQGNAVLQEQNRILSEKLLKTLDGYRSTKKKLTEAREENIGMRATMEEISMEFSTRLEKIRGMKQGGEQSSDVEKEISALKKMFENFEMKILKHYEKKGERNAPIGRSSSCKPFVLA
ncbi:hypothetical protein NMG60_11015199 [Bertholletia excelsa]